MSKFQISFKILKERPFRASDKGWTLTKGPLTGASNRPKWSSDSHTLWSLARRLLGVERAVTTFSQSFYVIFGRGSISECIPVDLDEISSSSSFFRKKEGSDALKDPA